MRCYAGVVPSPIPASEHAVLDDAAAAHGADIGVRNGEKRVGADAGALSTALLARPTSFSGIFAGYCGQGPAADSKLRVCLIVSLVEFVSDIFPIVLTRIFNQFKNGF